MINQMITRARNFPTFGWGLSLRPFIARFPGADTEFPHLRVGTFIEAQSGYIDINTITGFPHLRVGTFIEAPRLKLVNLNAADFPTFGWGLSLRLEYQL